MKTHPEKCLKKRKICLGKKRITQQKHIKIPDLTSTYDYFTSRQKFVARVAIYELR